LSIPVSFYYSPINNLKLYGGPEINIKLKSSSSESFGRYLSPFEEFEQIDYGAQVGLEYLIFQRFGIGIKNYFGFQYNGKMRGYRYISGSDPIIDDSKINRNSIFGVYLTCLIKS
jgi:hypothetical protein